MVQVSSQKNKKYNGSTFLWLQNLSFRLKNLNIKNELEVNRAYFSKAQAP